MATQSKRGLGRGLDALFGIDNATQQSKPMAEMAEVAITLIDPNPQQPRVSFDEVPRLPRPTSTQVLLRHVRWWVTFAME